MATEALASQTVSPLSWRQQGAPESDEATPSAYLQRIHAEFAARVGPAAPLSHLKGSSDRVVEDVADFDCRSGERPSRKRTRPAQREELPSDSTENAQLRTLEVEQVSASQPKEVAPEGRAIGTSQAPLPSSEQGQAKPADLQKQKQQQESKAVKEEQELHKPTLRAIHPVRRGEQGKAETMQRTSYVNSPSFLPPGWQVQIKARWRHAVQKAGDKFYITPWGTRFTSFRKLQEYCYTKGIPLLPPTPLEPEQEPAEELITADGLLRLLADAGRKGCLAEGQGALKVAWLRARSGLRVKGAEHMEYPQEVIKLFPAQM